MIFATIWKPPVHPYNALHDCDLPAARRYAADLFGWAAACRDYSYAQHPEPKPDEILLFVFDEIRARVLREFNRSNPGREIITHEN